MNFVYTDMIKYVSKPLMGFTAMYLFNIFGMNNNYKSSIALYDSWIFAGSILVSKLSKDVLMHIIKIDDNEELQYKLIEPIINAFVYAYIYDYFIRSKFSTVYKMREKINNYLIASIINLLLGYIENPLNSLFLNIKY